MDLGAMVCVPVSPRCDECPLTSCCRAFLNGLQREIPTPRRRPEPTAVEQAMIAVRRGRRFLLRRSPPGERWAGLWEFLRVPISRNGTVPDAELERAVAGLCGLSVETEAGGFDLRHTVTRFRIRLHCATARFLKGSPHGPGEYRWSRPDEFGGFALSMPARKFADRLAAQRDS